jgi:hypothetical protein
MLAILIAVRDALIALALSWVGVTLEKVSENQQACTSESCQTEQDR